MKGLDVDLKVVRDNLRKVIKDLGLKTSSFANMIGIDSSNFAKKMKGELPLNRNDFLKFQEAGISVEFLTTGEEPKYTGVVKGAQIARSTTAVPVYNEEFACGFLAFDNSALYPTGFVDMPGTRGATCWCKATGHSMEPRIENGDYVCLKRLEDWNDFLVFGDTYAVDTFNDMRTIKRIEHGSADDEYSLVPENREFSTQTIKKRQIRGLYRVLAVTKIL